MEPIATFDHENIKTWEHIKGMGSKHYKTDAIEPIDLYRAQGTLHHYCITGIMKYVSRNITYGSPVSVRDMNKIIHLAEMLKTVYGKKEE
jgi:hypothetical protein